jgi:hypothetical protein
MIKIFILVSIKIYFDTIIPRCQSFTANF